MDIDTLRELLRAGHYTTTREFQRRSDQRGFSLRQAREVIETGTIIEERPDQHPYPKGTVSAVVERTVAGVVVQYELHIAVALGDEVIFLTGYWKNQKRRRSQERYR